MSARKKAPSAIAQQPTAQLTTLPLDYVEFLNSLKHEIRVARMRAVVAVNREQILLYWRLGRQILAKEKAEGWGAKVVERLAADLRAEYPEMTGLSARNLRYMKTLSGIYPDEQILQTVFAKLSWSHIIVLLDKVNDSEMRLWYARKSIENGWSRNVLVHQIESGLYQRQGKLVHNFENTLPPLQSDLAKEIFKDPYQFEFLGLSGVFNERELEKALIERVRDFLIELGKGFAFVGSQYHLEVGGEDFYLDLLFYHLQLRSYIIIELKAGDFKPEYAGKLNFYLSAADDLLRHENDAPSIGLLLCKHKNRIIAEYAVRDIHKPMGVAEYRATRELPKELQDALPKLEELEAKLSDRQE